MYVVMGRQCNSKCIFCYMKGHCFKIHDGFGVVSALLTCQCLPRYINLFN